jgi:murein L,D-transpeptidase YcbB/YkuD
MFERRLVIVLISCLVAHGTLAAGTTHAAAINENRTLLSLYGLASPRLQWTDHGRPTRQARELSDILNAADTYGLRPEDYEAGDLAEQIRRLSALDIAAPVDLTKFDYQLSRAAIRLATHLYFGRIDSHAAGFDLQESRPPLDLAATVAAIASAESVAPALAAIEPPFYHYGLLKSALARYRRLSADSELTGLPPIGKKTLHLGDAWAGAPAARKLLTALGDLPVGYSPAPADDQRLDRALSEALQRFQSRHGLMPDGSLGRQTYAALTTPLAQRVRQIELTLERWRWLPAFKSPPIIVNIPQFRLFAFRTIEDRAANIMQMDVIVGRTYPRTRTPIFVGDMKYVIFRPYWDVPRGITVREMLPEIARHPDYLLRNNLEIVQGESDEGTVLAPTAANLAALAAGRLRLRQKPGDDNALGLVKFIFPNEHNVYMHATPAHRLFLQSRRAFSHGCIRVSDPNALAAFVLRNAAGAWDDQKIQDTMHGKDSTRVVLTKPIRVMILYATAQATEAGPVQFFDDIYGHDRRLEKLLGLAPVHGTNPRP